jgi:type I restriction enzyme S subunit
MTDWPVKTLGELFDSKPKNSESLKQKDYLSSGKFPVVDQGQELIGGFTNDQHLVRDFQTPVIVFGDHTRCVKYVDFPFASGADGTKILVPKKGVDPRYAYFQLLSIELPTKGYARHFGELSKHSFVLPPLQEQKRIVALLDAATARVTELTACYEQARTHANDLFSSALRDALESNPDWPVKTLGDISEISYGYTESAKSEAVGPKFLRITDIKDRGVNWDDVPYCPIDEVQLNRHRLKDGDIVFARTGATTGKSFLVTSPPLAVCASYLIRLRIDKKLILPDFLNLNFQTNGYWKQVNEGMSGAAQGGFNATKLGALEVPVPPLEEQKQIIARLDSIRAKTLEMVAAYDEKLSAAKNLRQSILEAAFAGEL